VTREGSEGGIAGGTYYLVRIGAFHDARGAVAARDALKARGYQAFVAQAASK
jgi:cell division septation protein DedD